MVISAKMQKVVRRHGQGKSLMLWKSPLPPMRLGLGPLGDLGRRIRIAMGHFLSSLETLSSQDHSKTRNGILISLGILVLTSISLPVVLPQTRYISLQLEIPEDKALPQLLSTMGHWEEGLTDATREKPVQTPGKLLKVLETSKYKVKNGEALSTIANRFGLALGTVISFNRIQNVKRIQVGMELTIPNQDGLLYTVARGDSLSLIAQKTGVSYNDLLDANNLESPVVQPGQKLFLPGATLSRVELRSALGEMFIMPAQGRLTSGYGYRKDPFTGVRRFHNGIDIANASGTPIKAVMEGRVSDVGYHSSYGNYIVISHDGGYQTMYAHLLSYRVAKGQRVSQGQSIAQMGNTGYSTGTHLHFSVFRRNIPVDPSKLLY